MSAFTNVIHRNLIREIDIIIPTPPPPPLRLRLAISSLSGDRGPCAANDLYCLQ